MKVFARNRTLVLLTALVLLSGGSRAQDRLQKMPAYPHFLQASRQLNAAMRAMRAGGPDQARWSPDSKRIFYLKSGKRFQFDMETRRSSAADAVVQGEAAQPGVRFRRGGSGLERGRQFSSVLSPDGKRKASYRDRNLWLAAADGSGAAPITTDGSSAARIKYGAASWVYGEELDQTSAIWWSPDSRRVAFYRFDESKVQDYYLATDTLHIQDSLNVEAYPKAGAPNPVADIVIYDTVTGKRVTVDSRDGQPFSDGVVGHYVYGVEWTHDGHELIFHRTNRKQDTMELCGCDPDTGKCRVIVREAWPASWTENSPAMRWLPDGQRFLWISERTGYLNLTLYDLRGKAPIPLTRHAFEVESIVRIDDAAGVVFYMARDGDSPYKLQLHRVNLDGSGERRLTNPAFTHRVEMAPNGAAFVDVEEAHDAPPATLVVDAEGEEIGTLGRQDPAALLAQGFLPGEAFRYRSADDRFDCHGVLYKPSNFDPNRRYPLLVMVYAGPGVPIEPRERFQAPNAVAELGFLVASFDGRGQEGQGKAFKDALYRHMGLPEIDDQAAGVRYLCRRPYVDGANVGIFGSSYGGYASIMALLRYPDVFRAASASSPVTDWRNYDTIYTERYMGLPGENRDGYDFGSAMNHVENMKGYLQLYYGTADNNVHPANTYQLIQALSRAGKSYDLQIGPDEGHSGIDFTHMLEFFIDRLILSPAPATKG